MPRRARQTPGGWVYHVINRAVGRMRIFTKKGDYTAFQQVMLEAHQHHPVRLLGYCLMPNHWHLVFWPQADGELSKFMHWMTMTHTQRWRHHRQLVGLGPLYQGRFKAFPVQTDPHLLTVLRYVERNPLRANLVERSEDWRYSSLRDREDVHAPLHSILHEWPIQRPADYLELVNRPQTSAEEQAMVASIRRGCPFGDAPWRRSTIETLGLQATVNPIHRPKRRAPSADDAK